MRTRGTTTGRTPTPNSNDSDDSDDSDDTYGADRAAGARRCARRQRPSHCHAAHRQVDGKHTDQDYRIEARVTDAANREVAGHSTVLATYGSFRVSAEPTNYVVKAGDPVRVKVTAQDYDNKPVQTAVHIAVP
jgi:uncharacterized iron-regulated membrane protein